MAKKPRWEDWVVKRITGQPPLMQCRLELWSLIIVVHNHIDFRPTKWMYSIGDGSVLLRATSVAAAKQEALKKVSAWLEKNGQAIEALLQEEL